MNNVTLQTDIRLNSKPEQIVKMELLGESCLCIYRYKVIGCCYKLVRQVFWIKENQKIDFVDEEEVV